MVDGVVVEELYRRYSGRLGSFIRGRTGSREDAEDLLQDLFLRAQAGLCCVEDWQSAERWLFRSARNRLIDHYRARRPMEVYEEGPGRGEEEDGDPGRSLAGSLREMVDGLPEASREALVLTAFEGLPQADYAARAGLTLAAAKSRVLRAREELKARLLACCHVELDRLGQVIDYEGRCARCDLARLSADRRGRT